MLLLLVVSSAVAAPADAQPGWEMRVCADPEDFPVSAEHRPGLQNRIAELVADELGAHLSYFWTTAAFEDLVENHLLPGDCDLVMGAGEGVMGLLSSIPYYRAPYVFVFRRDSGLRIRSLDDPLLGDLRISTYAGSGPHGALLRRGLGTNVVPVNALGPEPSAAILERVLAGETAVGIVYGPVAGYAARHENSELEIVPVAPELDPPLTPMYSTWTIGVRPQDDALRDRLNVALANRWDEVQRVLGEFGVPLLALPRPRPPGPVDAGPVLRLGVVLPTPAGPMANTDVVASAARIGAMITEGWLDQDPEGTALEISFASAPSARAAARAARRLVATEGATALIGGIGESQAVAIGAVAGEQDVLFFNIGSTESALRNASAERHVFHIEASGPMYVDGLLSGYADADHRRWFLVYPSTLEGRALRDAALETIPAMPGETAVVGTAAVAAGGHVYHEVLTRLRDVNPDAVLLLLDAVDQESFLSQYERARLGWPVLAFPDPLTQTRDFFTRLRQVAPSTGTGDRVALWETTLGEEAEEVIRRFTSRSGEPMDPSGWAAYAAVKILFDAAVATGSQSSSVLGEYLTQGDSRFDVHKGEPVWFRSRDRQLIQPLYRVKVETGARWGPQLFSRVALGSLVTVIPATYVQDDDP
jgi:ABC-type branched-subunit amino acid transport system substrate-binding protein/ABC-type amino acid transport substrate-binding protein